MFRNLNNLQKTKLIFWYKSKSFPSSFEKIYHQYCVKNQLNFLFLHHPPPPFFIPQSSAVLSEAP